MNMSGMDMAPEWPTALLAWPAILAQTLIFGSAMLCLMLRRSAADRVALSDTLAQKLAGWWKGNKDLVDPPERAEHGGSLKHPEEAEVSDEPEEQYNIRIRRSLKKRLKRLVIEEEKPMGVILEKMLELYLQHRARRAERGDESTK